MKSVNDNGKERGTHQVRRTLQILSRIFYGARGRWPRLWTAEAALVNYLVNLRFQKGSIIIGGCGRSGTTLLLGILSAHPEICAIPEETWMLYPRIEPIKLLKQIHRAGRQKRRSSMWCEKTPKNILNAGQIISFLGEKCRFIHIVRDGRDVVTSKHPSKPEAYWVDVDRWVTEVKAGLEAERHPQVKRVRYEDLVLRTRDTLTEIVEFSGLKLDEDMLNWEKTGTVKAHSAWFGEKVATHPLSVGRWQKRVHSERVMEFMQREDAIVLMQHLGYI